MTETLARSTTPLADEWYGWSYGWECVSCLEGAVQIVGKDAICKECGRTQPRGLWTEHGSLVTRYERPWYREWDES